MEVSDLSMKCFSLAIRTFRESDRCTVVFLCRVRLTKERGWVCNLEWVGNSGYGVVSAWYIEIG